jgi:processing peptidase subunit alpha
MPQIPLNQEWRRLSLKEAETPSNATQISTLSNGLKVVSTESTSPISSVGVFIDAGSRYETDDNSGISHFMELMAFKSTADRSDFKLVRDMLKVGANVMCASSREHMMFCADVLRPHVREVTEALADVIQNNAFKLNEVNEARENYEKDVEERTKNPEANVMESIHEAAWFNNTLGRPLYAPAHQLGKITPDKLRAYATQLFTPKRMVVSGVGLPHQEMIEIAQAAFSSLPADDTSLTKEKAQYTGGDLRQHKKLEAGDVHFALGFETASFHDKDLLAVCVLQQMMGGGGSFSTGGPGKGLYSRLYENMLNKYDWLENATCFTSLFSDSSLFGIYGSAGAEHGENLVGAIVQELHRMKGSVEAPELARAKAQLKSSVWMHLEQRAVQLEDMGRQVVIYGRVPSAQELCGQIDQVSQADIVRIATKMLRTRPSVAAYGDLAHIPRYDQIVKLFK